MILLSNYTYRKAKADLLDYLGINANAIREIENTNGRGFVYNVNDEDIVVFTYPISCKTINKQDFFDTRDSGAAERKAAWKYASVHHMKYFCLGINPEQEKYRDYILSLESREEDISAVSFRKSDSAATSTGTQVNIPNDFIPSGNVKRIRTPKGFYIAAIHRNYINEYLKCFDNRPYNHEDDKIEDTEETEEKVREEIPFANSKDSARKIIDLIYSIDRLKRIEGIVDNNDKSIKINTAELGGNYLRYIFIKPSSESYSENIEGKTRVFTDKDYIIQIKDKEETCRLSTEWISTPLGTQGPSANYLVALIEIVNQFYSDRFRIYEESGKWYIEYLRQDFSLNKLPESFDDVYTGRFVKSLIAKPFVILTGNSGTGKTRIAKQFAEYLEAKDEKEEKNWLVVPVGADWTDNSRIMGYYNPLANNGKGKYEKTEILRLIERANEHPDIPYFLILDEMNLSHVERYFSDFLSHMETSDNPFEITGYKANIAGKDQDSKTEKSVQDIDQSEITGKISYPMNLFVVGTVNIDETTYMFSPKVLDRANVIEFKPGKEDVLKLFNEAVSYVGTASANDGTAESFLKMAKAIRTGESALDDEQKDIISKEFDRVYDITARYGFEFAYRTVKEIRQYISAALMLADDPEQVDLYSIIDEQLLQKILPKIHGNKKEIGKMLDELKALCDEEDKELPLSSAKIKQMKGKLDAVQYASFI